MGAQRKVEPYGVSDAFVDGAGVRPSVAGSVPRTNNVVTARSGSAAYAMPVPTTEGLIIDGQTSYLAYCTACHGRLGNGDGMIVRRGFPSPPSFHAPRLRAESDAHFFNVITHGYGAMYALGDRIPAQDRWAIVAYVRALQVAPDVARNVDARDRATLLMRGDPNGPSDGGTRER